MRVLLALPLVLTTACGDNLSGPAAPDGEGADPSGAADGETAVRYVPEVCASQALPSVRLDAKDTMVRTVPYAAGTAVFSVPRSGGMLRGVLVDPRGYIVGNHDGQKIRSDLNFTSLSASRVDERFIVGLVDGDRTHVTAVRDDLGDFRELAVADGAPISDTTVMRVRGGRVTLTGGATGIVATTFDTEWAARGSEIVSANIPTSMSSAPYGSDAVVAWSTESECHVQSVATQTGVVRPHACQNARIAVDFASRGGWMLYERGDGIMIVRIAAGTQSVMGNERRLASGSSPRIAFDGTTYWASYIGAHGDVMVGMLDDTGNLSTASTDARPASGHNYDLAVGSNTASIFAVDDTRLAATQLCKTRL